MKKLFLLLFLTVFSLSAFSVDEKTFIPPKAFAYKDMVKTEIDKHFPDIPTYYYVPSLVEHESCAWLTSKTCWDAKAQLKTAREEGAGLSQTTRTYNKDGTIRFDTLSDMRRQYKKELGELAWSNIYSRPDLQIRSLVLMTRDNYKKLYAVSDNIERLKMTDSAYNGGYGSVVKKRRACGLSANCNPQVWTGNVGAQCLGMTTPIYGKRSACDINKHHVANVFDIKLPKYTKYYNFDQ